MSRTEPRRVLFTGGGGAATEALVRLLAPRYEVHFADADPDAKPGVVAPERWHTVPFASAPGFVEALSALCAQLHIDLLAPGVDEELLLIAAARDRIAPDVLLPSAAFVARHLDKFASQQFLAERSLPAPRTELLEAQSRVTFPCIVKPRRGRGSRHVALVSTAEELRAHVLLSRRPAADFIVQEYVEGQEYTVTMAASRSGELRAIVPVKVGVKRGVTLRAHTERNERVVEACAAIHAADPVAGCFNIQLVETRDGAVKPFEINPRISTTTCLALAAGVDVIDLFFGGGQAGRLAPYHDGLYLKRSWTNEFLTI